VSKTIVITGGSRGIGAAAARLCGKRGWSVVINYASDKAAAENTLKAVEQAGGRGIIAQGDMSLEKDVIALFDAAVKAFGKIDGVVNNAGILLPPPTRMADISYERLRRVVDVNLIGSFLVAREAIRRMAKSRGGNGGVIVNNSSAAVKLGGANENIDYAASKGGIESMTIGMAKEVGTDGIRVVTVRPGLIETDIHAAGGVADRPQRLGSTVPLGRTGTADEVGEAIVWLLSDEASYVHGTVVEVTGGR
jgi:NAD(P)-dependent dehydrogenase (short-subunit alcohol dehydrogenase family)